MNQFANYLQYQSKRVLPIYQQQCYSKSPQVRRALQVNQQFSPNEPKYMKQFVCKDETKFQNKPIIYPVRKQSPTNKKPFIATKLRNQDKENNNFFNANIVFQPCKTPRENKNKLNTQFSSSNVKQPTPQFENRYDCNNQEFQLSDAEIHFRFVDSENHTTDENQLLNINDQLNKIQLKEQSISPKSARSDEYMVQIDSVKKNNSSIISNTKNVAIQAFESTQFDKPEQQLGKILGSLKKVKIIKKKQSQPTQQTQVTQKTMEDDSIVKLDTQQDQNMKTISGLSNIEFQSEKFQTEYTDLDSNRVRNQSNESNQLGSFRQNISTPKQLQQQNKISFLMYKKQFEKQKK